MVLGGSIAASAQWSCCVRLNSWVAAPRPPFPAVSLLPIICVLASLEPRTGSNRSENEGAMPDTLGEDLTANVSGWATAECFIHVINHSFPLACNVQRALQPEN